MRIPNLYVIYRDSINGQRVPLVVLEVVDFHMKRLGITRVIRVDPCQQWAAHQPDKLARVATLLEKEYCCFAQACQCVYAASCGEQVRTAYMNRFEVYVRGDIDPSLIGTATQDRLSHGESVIDRLSPLLAAASAETFAEPPLVRQESPAARWEGWITVGEGRPYAHSSTPTHRVEAIVAQMQREGRLSAPQHPRDGHKRSHAEANPLEEGEMREGKPRKSGKRRAKALQPGRLVFLAHHARTPGDAHSTHPHVVVSSGPERLGGAHQATSCVVVRPLPKAASLPESTHPVGDVIGLAVDFERTWRELVTPGSQLEEAMHEAVEEHRARGAPTMSRSTAAAWNQLAPGLSTKAAATPSEL